MILEETDRNMLVGAVRDFSRMRLSPLVERPENPADRQAMNSVGEELVTMGVLAEDAPAGFGIWDDIADSQCCRLSVDLLGELAAVSSAVALEVSNRALAGALQRVLGVSQRGSVAFDGSVSGGGRITGRSLVADPLSADWPLLSDLWGRPALRPRLHVGDPDWSMLW